MHRNASKLLLIALVVLGVGACSESETPITGDDNNNGNREQCPVAADIGVPSLTDEDILQVIMTVNMGEIQQGQLAQQQAMNPDVRRFADQMIQEHTASNQQIQTFLQNQGITPSDNPLSRQLMAETNQILAVLQATGGGETFDLAYMDVQVSLHAKTLFLMDSVIQRQLQRSELRDLAQRTREQVQQHLDSAVTIQRSLRPVQ